MSNLFEFYMNLGGNILDIALLFRIAQTCLKKRIENKHKIIFLCIYFITHIPVNISFPILNLFICQYDSLSCTAFTCF